MIGLRHRHALDVAVAAADAIIIWLGIGKRGARVAAPRIDDAVELEQRLRRLPEAAEAERGRPALRADKRLYDTREEEEATHSCDEE